MDGICSGPKLIEKWFYSLEPHDTDHVSPVPEAPWFVRVWPSGIYVGCRRHQSSPVFRARLTGVCSVPSAGAGPASAAGVTSLTKTGMSRLEERRFKGLTLFTLRPLELRKYSPPPFFKNVVLNTVFTVTVSWFWLLDFSRGGALSWFFQVVVAVGVSLCLHWAVHSMPAGTSCPSAGDISGPVWASTLEAPPHL